MAHLTYWINFSVARYMGQGVASLLSCCTHPATCRVRAQRLEGNWLGADSWHSPGVVHPSLDLDLAVGLDLYKQFASSQLRLDPPALVRLDGATYSLEVGIGDNIIKVRWSGMLPVEWKDLQPIADKMEALGEQCLALKPE